MCSLPLLLVWAHEPKAIHVSVPRGVVLWRVPEPILGLENRLPGLDNNILEGVEVSVGRGQMEPDDIGALLAARDRRAAPAMAPATGLYLAGVQYA